MEKLKNQKMEKVLNLEDQLKKDIRLLKIKLRHIKGLDQTYTDYDLMRGELTVWQNILGIEVQTITYQRANNKLVKMVNQNKDTNWYEYLGDGFHLFGENLINLECNTIWYVRNHTYDDIYDLKDKLAIWYKK